jgi:hypothetical protein
MEADELKHRHASIDMQLPLPSKAPSRRRPQNYSEFLICKLKGGPVRPTLWQRLMLPMRHLIVHILVLLALGILFLGLGYFLWRVALPESYSIQSPDLNSILLGGWFIVVGIFALGISLSWLQSVVALFCCGRGLVRTLE